MKLFLLKGLWFNSPTAVVVASTLNEAIELVSQENVLCPWFSTTVVVVGEWELAEDHNKAEFQFFIVNDGRNGKRKTLKELREEIETSIEKVREALTAGPATLYDIAERIGKDASAVGFALGALGARNEIGYSKGTRVALKEESVRKAKRPFAYQTVLDSLRNDGPGTFKEISERTGITQPSEIGFALGWIYGEGKIVFRGSPRRERWHCKS